MTDRKLAGNWLLFGMLVLLIAALLIGSKVGAQGDVIAPVIAPVPVDPAASGSLISWIERIDPNVVLIVALIAGGLFAVLSHFKEVAWVKALRDSVPVWVRNPVGDALDGGSNILLDALARRAAETPETYDDEQVEQLRRRIDALEEWLRANPQGAAPGAVKVNLDLPQG